MSNLIWVITVMAGVTGAESVQVHGCETVTGSQGEGSGEKGSETGVDVMVVDGDERRTSVDAEKDKGLDKIDLLNEAFNSPVGKAAAVVFGYIEGCDESVEEPRVGMVFCSWEDLEVYYKSYGKRMGFGIARVGCAKRKAEMARTSMTWRCEQ